MRNLFIAMMCLLSGSILTGCARSEVADTADVTFSDAALPLGAQPYSERWPSGNMKRQGSMIRLVNGTEVMAGRCTEWSEDGREAAIGIYANGKKVGTWIRAELIDGSAAFDPFVAETWDQGKMIKSINLSEKAQGR